MDGPPYGWYQMSKPLYLVFKNLCSVLWHPVVCIHIYHFILIFIGFHHISFYLKSSESYETHCLTCHFFCLGKLVKNSIV